MMHINPLRAMPSIVGPIGHHAPEARPEQYKSSPNRFQRFYNGFKEIGNTDVVDAAKYAQRWLQKSLGLGSKNTSIDVSSIQSPRPNTPAHQKTLEEKEVLKDISTITGAIERFLEENGFQSPPEWLGRYRHVEIGDDWKIRFPLESWSNEEALLKLGAHKIGVISPKAKDEHWTLQDTISKASQLRQQNGYPPYLESLLLRMEKKAWHVNRYASDVPDKIVPPPWDDFTPLDRHMTTLAVQLQELCEVCRAKDQVNLADPASREKILKSAHNHLSALMSLLHYHSLPNDHKPEVTRYTNFGTSIIQVVQQVEEEFALSSYQQKTIQEIMATFSGIEKLLSHPEMQKATVSSSNNDPIEVKVVSYAQ